jgi:membrane protein required for colicin V production
LSAWSILDSVLVGIVLFSVAFSAVKGFTRELVSLLALAWGFLLACWSYPTVAGQLPLGRAPNLAALTAFLGILLVALIAGGFLSRWAGRMVDRVGLRWFDRVLGISVGLVRGCLFCMVVVVILAVFAPEARPLVRSRLAPYLIHGARVLVSVAPSELRDRFHSGWERVQEILRGQPER